MRYVGVCPYGVASRSWCATHESGGVRVTFTGMTLRDFSESVEEGEKWTKEKICHLQEIASPHLRHMMAQECFPGLSTDAFWATLPHIPLDGSFTHPNIELEQFTTKTFRPEDADCWLPSP
jgi:hypothetical protein